MKKIAILLLVSFPIVAISQNVGIGTTVPETKLNIVGTGSNPAIPGGASGALLRLGISSNQEGIDLGKMNVSPFSAWVQSGFNGTTPDPLTLQPLGGNVGIGTLYPTDRLDVNGNINLTGTLKVNGNPGIAGQVLVSGGSGDPLWTSGTYPGSDRLMIPIGNSSVPGSALYTVNLETPYYNLNTSVFSTTSTNFTINKTGLYEISGTIFFSTGSVEIRSEGGPFAELNLGTTQGSVIRNYRLIYQGIDKISSIGSESTHLEAMPFTLTLHINSGTAIILSARITGYFAAPFSFPSVAGSHIGVVRIAD